MKKLVGLLLLSAVFIGFSFYAHATVSVTTTRIQYSCNGSTTAFTYPFKIFEDDDLDVFKTDSSGTETTLILNTEYTVSGAGDAAGGTVTLAAGSTCPSGYTLTFLRNIDFTQDTDFSDGGAIQAATLEIPPDKSRIIDQQMNEALGRSIKVAKSSTLTDLTVIPAANEAIFFDSAGTGLETRSPGSTTLAVPADESVTAAKLSTADVAAINTKLGTDAWLFNDAYIIVGSVTGADYASLAAYLAASPAAGDHVIVTEDQTVISQTIIPDNITIEFFDGARLLSSTGLATSTLQLGDNVIVRGVLNVFLNHTGTIAKAVEFNGDNIVGMVNVENGSTGTLTTAYHVVESTKGSNIQGYAKNSGGGTLTNVIFDNATTTSNYYNIVDSASNELKTGGGSTTFADAVTLADSVTFEQPLILQGAAWPSFSAYNSAGQTVDSATITKLTLDTEAFDTNSNFDSTTNYRFTPTVAGKYLLTATVNWNGAFVDQKTMTVYLYKNGAAVKQVTSVSSGTAAQGPPTMTAIVDANGSTDYFEIFVFHNTGAQQATRGGASGLYTWFEGARIG